MKRRAAVSVGLAALGLVGVALAAPGFGGEGPAAARSTGSPAQAADLIAKVLQASGGAEEVVFAVRGLYEDGHYYANFGHWSLDPARMMYARGGARLDKLNLRTRKLTVLRDDREGSIRDPHVDYDGQKIVFSYRPGGTKYFHLYQIGVDGNGLRQLTDGPFDDIEPACLPDGGIVFLSSRCRRFVACWYTPVATLHRIDADGGNLRILSSNIVHENTPAVLPDGRMLYTRWEYVDRAPQKFHGLWSMNPDGTGQRIVFGNMQPPGKWMLMIDAKPIPGSEKLVAIFSPGHGNREHAGHVVLVDPRAGPDDPKRATRISPEVPMANGWMGGQDGFRDPYPLSEDCFLVAQDKSLLILDGRERLQEVYRAEQMIHEPSMIRRRSREPVLAARSDLAQRTGRLILANVHAGRNMTGVKPGEIKRLLVLEQLPRPVAFSGVQQTMSMNGTHTLKRILGTVPVEADGSAYLEAPALRSLYFVAMDAQGRTVKRMQSFCTVMPGETTGCVGCHEGRTETPRSRRDLAATRRPPSRIEPIKDVPEVIDYPRDIQPIFDKHCVKCHSAEKPEGRVQLTGDYNEWFTQSYYALFSSDQVSDSQGYDEDGNRAPRRFGSPASALMQKIDGSHYEAKLSPTEQRRVRLWIDTGATYPGTYAACRPGAPPTGHSQPGPGYPPAYATVNTGAVRAGEPSVEAILKRRCLVCHNAALPLGPGIHKTQSFLNVPKYCLNLYNLTQPEKSMIFLASMAKEAGGYGWCKSRSAAGRPDVPAPVFRDARDPDYQVVLRAIRAAKTELETMKRFDMPGFRPNEHYLREMKRYGILPADFDTAKDPIDVYATDRAYWQSLWHQPAAVKTASATQ